MIEKVTLQKRKGYHWFVVGTVCVGAFMAALDASIINVAMPTLSKSFSVGMDSVEWVSIAYLLTLTSLLTLLGSLSDKLGRKFLYTLGFAVFGLGSGLCGLTTTMPLLIAARILQAVGAAMLQANSIALITLAAPSGSRGKAIGIQGSAQAIGLSIGPTVGGLLIAKFSWRSIFYINIPVAIIGTLIAGFILPKDKPNLKNSRFDYIGSIFFAPAIILFVLVLENGYKLGWLSRNIILEFITAILLFTFFILHEKKAQNPMINLDLFKIMAFTGGNIAGLLSYSLMFGIIFLMPFYLEWILNLSPFFVGLIMTVVSLAMFIMSPFSGALADRFGSKILTGCGMLIASLGSMILILLSDKTPFYIDLIGLIFVGAGMGLFTPPNNSSVMGSAPPDHVGVAGGILNMSRSLGMSMGVAVASTLYNSAFKSLYPTHHIMTGAQLLSFHAGFEGMTVLGIIGALISVLTGKRSNVAEVSFSENVSFHI